MKQFNLTLLLTLCLIILGLTGSARMAGASKAPINLTPMQWVGHNFIFLALPADKQADGYGIFSAAQAAAQGFQEDRSARIPYLANVGKIVTVTDVSPYTAGDSMYDYVVSMTEISTGYKLVGRTFRGALEGLALAEDIVQAREEFLGKMIYPKSRSLELVNEQSSGMNPMSVSIPIGSGLTVMDVYAGIESKEPIWLIFLVNGQKAFLRTAYSWTNQSVNIWKAKPPWHEALFIDDPRMSLGFSRDLWTKIESGTVEHGMTKDQVCLSWGPPNRVDQGDTEAIWFYGDKVLKFTGDQLTSMKTIESPYSLRVFVK